MELKNSILEAIGNTPLVRLNKVTAGISGELYAKCEFMNPGGSIKDRIGYYMVEKAEKKGALKPGGTVVEATSGNTGMGLAIACAVKDYKSIFVMPDKMSEEKRQNLRAFGAKVVITPSGVAPDAPNSHYSTGSRIAQATANSYYGNQYHNADNPETHYLYTGPEIWRQTEGKFDAIIIGMGTCGTISGLGKFFKEKNPNIKIVGVDPKGSILKDLFETGKHAEAHSYKVEGIGEDMKPLNCDFSVIDEIVRVDDKESLLMTRSLLTKEGVFCGTSSGAAVAGAMRWMKQQAKPLRVIVILPDSGNRYLSKVFNDAWMIENSFLEKSTQVTLGEILKSLNKTSQIHHAEPAHRVDDVVKIMKEQGVSQLPVIHSGGVQGIISESGILKALVSGSLKPADKIESIIENHFQTLTLNDSSEKLSELFAKGQVCLVENAGKIQYILTKIDYITFLSQQSGAVI